MARPKLDDPTVPISFRMKRSAAEWWTQQAQGEETTLPKLIRRVLEEKADRVCVDEQVVAKRVAKSLERQVQPIPTKGKSN